MATYEYKRSANDKTGKELYRRRMDDVGSIDILIVADKVWGAYRPSSSVGWWGDEGWFEQVLRDPYGNRLKDVPVAVTDDDDTEEAESPAPKAVLPFQGLSIPFPEQPAPALVDLDKIEFGHAYRRYGNVYFKSLSGTLSDSRNGPELGSAAGCVDLGLATVTVSKVGVITISPNTLNDSEYVYFSTLVHDVKPGDWFKLKGHGGAVCVVLSVGNFPNDEVSKIIFYPDGLVRSHDMPFPSTARVRRLGNSPLRISIPEV
jgi:hypothetical protein